MFELDDTKLSANNPATTREGDGAATFAEAHASTSGDAGRAGPDIDVPEIKLPARQGDAKARGGKAQYHVEELLQYHDKHFVENAYHALLGRAPSEAEHARQLDELRGGRVSKVEFVERLEGLPSPLMRRLSGVPVVGYLLRLARALVRLPLLMEHQQQFEIYTVAQQQLITDHVDGLFALAAQGNAAAGEGDAPLPIAGLSQHGDIIETLAMFSDALIDLSNGHAELQTQVQTQGEQVQAALADLTQAVTAQQQITETLRREQQTTADAQQEFLIQEQRVIVETQKVVLAELREELRALAQREQDARAELDAEVRRLQALLDTSANAAVVTPPS
jgi:hypothetical protein